MGYWIGKFLAKKQKKEKVSKKKENF